MSNRILILMGVFVFVMAVNGRTEDEEKRDVEYDLGEVIVTATKTEQYQAHIGSSTTVLTSEDIEKMGEVTVLEILRFVPGVTVTQSGGFGGTTRIYLRGLRRGHTLVLIDGVEVNDPMSVGRSFDFANLTTDNIERIEIVRGPQSTLYGSDAMGGVISIITKKGRGKPEMDVSVEAGSYNTFREFASIDGDTGKTNYSFSVSRVDSDGISRAAEGSEKDGYENATISSKIGRVFESGELSFVTRFTDSEADVDDGGYDDDPNFTSWEENFVSRLGFSQTLRTWWEHEVSLSVNSVRRKNRDEKDDVEPSDYSEDLYKGENLKFEWQHNFPLTKLGIVTGGFEYEEESGSSYYYSESAFGEYTDEFDRKSVSNKGYYLQNQIEFMDSLFITPGLRLDDNEAFGSQTTYKVSTAYLVKPIDARLKANWGTGFKAPSLYQLYSSYGNADLSPEESESYDFGFERNFDRLSFGLTYFHNDFDNMIDWDPATWEFKNIERAETKGFEVEAEFLPVKDLTIGASFTYIDTEDKETGLELLRRPETQTSLNINWKLSEGANINLGITYVGSRKDIDFTSYPYERIDLEEYTRVDLSLGWDLGDYQIFGRIENLLDEEYQEVYGFASEGLSFYAGVKTSF